MQKSVNLSYQVMEEAMNSPRFLVLLVVFAVLFPATAASAATIVVCPIDVKGEPPEPYSEKFGLAVWEALWMRLREHMYLNVRNYNDSQKALKDASMDPEDLTDKSALVKVRKEISEDGIVAIHITVTASKKKKNKPRQYGYVINVIMYNPASGYLIKVLKKTIKAKKRASVTGLAILLENAIIVKGNLEKKTKKRNKQLDTDAGFAQLYQEYADKNDDRNYKTKQLTKALHVSPEDLKLWTKFIEMHRKAKDWKKISEAFEEAVLVFDNDANMYGYKAEIAIELRKLDEAKTAIKKALEIDPDNIRVLHLKAEILFGSREFEEAKAVYEKLEKLYTDDTVKKAMMDMIAECDKKIQEAKKKEEKK
ncbi:MAG: tetratricopeptide repeat protein [Planctomycetota bacterium]|nr:MAG: tetratricopeptide repeat protein [Planctomycetota bacterium]